MKSILVALTCPRCMYTSHKKSETLINPLFEPECKQALLKETYFMHRCPQCHYQLTYVHDCLYIDQRKHYMILLKISEGELITQQKQPHIHIMRKVEGVQSFVEKIRIFDADLNDYALELLKYRLKKERCLSDIHFEEYDVLTHILWFQIQRDQIVESIGVKEEVYQSFLQKAPSVLSNDFLEVKECWAASYQIG